MRTLFTVLTLLTGSAASAQVSSPNTIAPANPMVGYSLDRAGHFFAGNDGQPIRYNTEAVLVSGSPYLFTSFMPARVVLPTGAVYEGVPVRLNLLNQQLEYRNTKGNELVTDAAVTALFIRDSITNTYHKMVPALNLPPQMPARGWYEVLAEGNATLYKRVEKMLLSRKPYNSATEEKWVESKERYFVVRNNIAYEVKKPKDLLEPLSDKAAELARFLSEQGKKTRNSQELLTAGVLHYNGG